MPKFYSLSIRAALAMLALTSIRAVAQSAGGPELRLVAGTYRLPAGAFDKSVPAEAVNGLYFRLIQFDRLPSDAERAALTAGGQVELLDYLPQNAYLAAFRAGTDPATALRGLPVRAVLAVDPEWKLSRPLSARDYPSYALRPNNRLAVRVRPYAPIARADAAARLRALGAELAETQENPELLEVTIAVGAERTLAAQPWVQTVEAAEAPPTLEGERDVTNHRSNVLNSSVPGGRRLDGTNVVIAIGDDGSVGPHIDYQGRLTNVTSSNSGTHADHVVGIVGGAPNFNPAVRGQAPGATLRVYSNYNDITTMTGTTGQYATQAVRISTHSLGQTCNGGYTSDARTSDQHIRLNSALMYVHSAGNSGTSNCTYGGGTGVAGWGNITGGYKMGKNVLAVGNLSNTDALSSSSSRGPATDGRIKPDICAVGSDVNSTQPDNTYTQMSGTSMAAPAMAGALAQLYQGYRNLNGGADPNSALVKAAVLNTADDLGNAGPDFRFGYGRLNALRAVEVLENNRFATNTISTGQTQTVSITVPANASELKVMLYWADYEAAANAATALVNDLDLTLSTPGGTPVVYQPWVLNPAPNATTLNAPATRGTDRLNNVEQVTLDAPAAGTYTATISGFGVPQGPQRYYVVYSWVENNVRLTYPLGGESLVPGQTETLRWDANTTATGFTLEYSLNAGGSWTSIGTATAATRSRTWTVPTAASGQVRVRVTRGAQTSTSENFTVAGVPANLRTEWVCATETRLAWDAVAGATGYEVFKLGPKYMDAVGTTTALAYTVTGVAAGSEHYFSVRALGVNGMVGRRTVALRRVTGTSGCPSQPPVAVIGGASLTCPGVPAQLLDATTENPTGWLWSASPGPVTYVGGTSATSQHPQMQFGSAGPQTISLTVTNAFGSNSTTRVLTVSNGTVVQPGTPFAQPDFAGTWPPAGWQVQTSGGAKTWEQSGLITGPTGTTTRFAALNNYAYNAPGAEDALVLPRLNLAGMSSPQLRFFVAYAPYNASSTDSLRVDAAGACTSSFAPTSFQKGGLALGTAGGYQTSSTWAPTSAAQWREEIVDLSTLVTNAGEGSEVRLVNINDFGQWLYVGGIVVEGQGTLPLTLTEFRAARAGARALLTWQTAQEKNTARFGIERSRDGHRWESLAHLPAAGTTTAPQAYRYTDGAAPTALTYYRLRMEDADGAFRYSEARTLAAVAAPVGPLLAWPVPMGTAEELHVRAGQPVQHLELLDQLGRVVRALTPATPTTDFTLGVRGLPAGVYVVRTRRPDGTEERATVVR